MMFVVGRRNVRLLVHLVFVCNGLMFQTDAVEESRFDQNLSLHPYFDFEVVRNVTTRVGQTAFLNCRVEQLGDKSVSWIRKRDLHILTAGILTYTSDERFQVIRPENSDHWTLQIRFPQARDSGIYECQVNTEPKMSMAFRLNVVEAKAEIQGPRDLYVKTGSLVTLSCKVSQGPHELGSIHWYQGSIPLDPKRHHSHHPNEAVYEPSNRISIDTEWTDLLRSRLKVRNAKLSDSGNYSCLTTMAEGDSVTVHVINGEHPAAMQRGGSIRLKCFRLGHLLVLLTMLHSLSAVVSSISSGRKLVHTTSIICTTTPTTPISPTQRPRKNGAMTTTTKSMTSTRRLIYRTAHRAAATPHLSLQGARVLAMC